MNTAQMLTDILRAEICEDVLAREKYSGYDEDGLLKLAKQHDVVYCVTDALTKADLFPTSPLAESYTHEKQLAIYRLLLMTEALQTIRQALTDAGVSFMLLKGAQIRSLYPDEAMRSSCDIDVLIREDAMERAVAALVGQGFTTDHEKHYHDMSFYKDKVHLELHFSLHEAMEDVDGVLDRVWENAVPVTATEYRESPEFFVFHHIAHMNYHFVQGGCGVRPFADMFVMSRRLSYDEAALEKLLEETGLSAFYRFVRRMNRIWFEGEASTEQMKMCEDYILGGGAFGTHENGRAVETATHNGAIKTAWHKAFPPYKTMCGFYPVLREKRYLIVPCHIRRLSEKLFQKKARKNLKAVLKQDRQRLSDIDGILRTAGVKQR